MAINSKDSKKKERAARLRAEINKLEHDTSGEEKRSPRELTDEAAGRAAKDAGTKPSQDN